MIMTIINIGFASICSHAFINTVNNVIYLLNRIGLNGIMLHISRPELRYINVCLIISTHKRYFIALRVSLRSVLSGEKRKDPSSSHSLILLYVGICDTFIMYISLCFTDIRLVYRRLDASVRNVLNVQNLTTHALR